MPKNQTYYTIPQSSFVNYHTILEIQLAKN